MYVAKYKVIYMYMWWYLTTEVLNNQINSESTCMDHQGTEIHICVHVNCLQYINASKLKIYISSSTGGTPQDAYK